MKKYTLLLFTFIYFVSQAQLINMSTGTNNVICATGGTLFDSGGALGSYSDNESFVMTVCPGSPGFGVFADMNSMTIAAGDVLNIYNGNNISAPLFPDMPLDQNTAYATGAQFQSSVTNTTGCLTFEFISNGDGVVGDFEFALSCNARCQTFYSSISSSIPDTTYTPDDIYLDVCLGDTVFVTGIDSFPENGIEYAQSNATSTFEWYWESTTTVPDSGISQSHYYANVGGYRAKLISYDINGCRNFEDYTFKVRVAPIPEFVSLEDSVICLGSADTLMGLPAGELTSAGVIQGDTIYFVPPFSSGDSASLPDGNGSIHISPAFISGFDAGDTIQDCGGILEVCLNLEHSYLGDLNIELVCPSDQSVTLKAFPGGGGTYLGNPYDGTQQNMGAGDGLQYCFSSTSTNGLLVNGPTQAATNTAGQTVIPNTYQPVDLFTDFVGCPLNGQWELQIQDNLTVDDGYLFEWSLDFAPCLQPEQDSFVMIYNLGSWLPEPSINDIVGDSNVIEVEPLVSGLTDYTYRVADQFGCEYEHVYPVFVDSFEVVASPEDTTVCAGESIQLNTLVSGASGALSYTWTPPTDLNNSAIANPISTLSASDIEYSVGVTNTNGCVYYDTVNVNAAASFQFDAYGDTTICAGDTVQLFTTGGALTTAWTPNNGSISDTTAANPFVYPTTTTTYTVKGDSSGCSQFRNITVNVSNINFNFILPSDADCNGSSNGSILAIANGGLGSITYTLQSATDTTIQTSPSFNNLVGGDYIIIADDSASCPVDTMISLQGGLNVAIDSIYSQNPFCEGDTSGIIEIYIDTNVAASYSIDGGATTQSSNIFTGLNTGIYDIEVQYGNCPSATASDTLTAAATLNALLIDSNDLFCNGDSTGAIYLSGEQGVEPYQYSLDNVSYQTDSFFTGLSAGNYTMYVLDNNGCRDSVSTILSEPAPLEITNLVLMNALCYDSLGSISFDGLNGTLPYQYSIDSGVNYSSTNVFNNLDTGDYILLIRDTNMCLSIDSMVSITEPNQLVLTEDSTNSSTCGASDGAIYVSTTGGTGSYSYSLNGGTAQSTGSFLGLTSGVYSVSVTDANGCNSTISVTVSNFGAPTLSISMLDSSVSCFGDTTGMVQLSVIGGTAPYSYSVNGGAGQSDSLFTGLGAGVYNFTVSDAVSCSASIPQTITEPSPLDVTAIQDSTTCNNGTDGSIILTANGGTMAYSYALNDTNTQQMASMFNSLEEGNYVGYAIDNNGCIDSVTQQVYEPDSIIINTIMIDSVSCFGSADGIITVTSVTGGTPNYTYSYDGGASFDSSNMDTLAAGSYTIQVVDVNGCPSEVYSAIVYEPNQLVLTEDSTNSSTCGASDGEIYVSATGGTTPYSYSLNGGTAQSTGSFLGLISGVYSVSVTDANGCNSTISVTVSNFGAPTLSISMLDSSVSCFGDTTGMVQLSAVGGTAPYSYSVNGGAGQSDSLFTGLGAGVYNFTVSDAVSCSASIPQTITEPSPLDVTAIQDSTTCNNGTDGSIILTANGGTMAYSYALNDTNTQQMASMFNSLEEGNYVGYAIDNNGCIDSVTQQVYEPDSIIINTIMIDSVSCFGSADGIITVTSVTGGTPNYTYSYDGGASFDSSNMDTLAAGSYTIQVVDVNGCPSATYNAIIYEPTQLILDSINTTSTNCATANGSIEVQATGGIAPYNYSLNGGAAQSSGLFANAPSGVNSVSVSDMNGCVDTINIFVDSIPNLVLSVQSFDSVSCGGYADASVVLQASGGQMPYTYTLVGGVSQDSASFNNLSGGTNVFVLSDGIGNCTDTVTVNIYEPSTLVLTSMQDSVSCNTFSDGSITLSASGGGTNYSYALNDTSTTQSSNVFSGLASGVDTVYVLDENNCLASAIQEVYEPDTLIITNVTTVDISCDADGSFTIDASGGTMPYSYTLNGASAQSSNVFTVNTAGTYTLGVIDAKNCPIATAIDSITAPAPVSFTIDTATDTLRCNGENLGFISISGAGGTSPYEYSIDNGVSYQTDSFFTNLSAGTYIVVIRDMFSCPSTSTTITIYEPNAIASTSTSTGVLCNGDETGSISIISVSGGTGPYEVTVNGETENYTSNLMFDSLSAGTYSISIEDAKGCMYTYSETVADVSALAMSIDTVRDVSCFGAGDGRISLSATGGTADYDFSIVLGSFSDSTTSSGLASFTDLSGTETGQIYTLVVSDANGCEVSDTQRITQPNQLLVDSIVILNELSCFGAGDAALIAHVSGGNPNSTSPLYTYLWTPTGFTTDKISGLTDGVYTVTVTDSNNCTITSSQTIASVDPVLATIVPDSGFVTMGDTLELGVNVENAIGTNLQYNWSPSEGLSCTDCENPVVTIYNDIAYSVTVTDSNGCASFNFTEVYVTVDGSLFYFIPNAFSPNSDNINDVFQVLGQDIQSVNMIVFNRWGEKVFEGTNQFLAWDGTFKGVMQQTGVYTYVINVKFLNDVEIQKKGSVTLLR